MPSLRLKKVLKKSAIIGEIHSSYLHRPYGYFQGSWLLDTLNFTDLIFHLCRVFYIGYTFHINIGINDTQYFRLGKVYLGEVNSKKVNNKVRRLVPRFATTSLACSQD